MIISDARTVVALGRVCVAATSAGARGQNIYLAIRYPHVTLQYMEVVRPVIQSDKSADMGTCDDNRGTRRETQQAQIKIAFQLDLNQF